MNKMLKLSKKIIELDGLRGLAILLVVFSHLGERFIFKNSFFKAVKGIFLLAGPGLIYFLYYLDF